MRAAVFQGVGRPLSIESRPDPEPGPAELVLAVKSSGICGSDLHLTEIADAGGGIAPLPRGAVLGHEFSGEVVAVGRAIAGRFRSGDRVTALPYIACGSCAPCLAGQGHRCPAVVSAGLGKLPGAYAEYVRVGVHETLPLPAAVDFRAGAMVEPLSVGLHAVDMARLAGEAVLVIGAGPHRTGRRAVVPLPRRRPRDRERSLSRTRRPRRPDGSDRRRPRRPRGRGGRGQAPVRPARRRGLRLRGGAGEPVTRDGLCAVGRPHRRGRSVHAAGPDPPRQGDHERARGPLRVRLRQARLRSFPSTCWRAAASTPRPCCRRS